MKISSKTLIILSFVLCLKINATRIKRTLFETTNFNLESDSYILQKNIDPHCSDGYLGPSCNFSNNDKVRSLFLHFIIFSYI